jgi:hypothetical protein
MIAAQQLRMTLRNGSTSKQSESDHLDVLCGALEGRHEDKSCQHTLRQTLGADSNNFQLWNWKNKFSALRTKRCLA